MFGMGELMDVGDEVKSWANRLPGAPGSSMSPAALLFTSLSASCLYILIAGLFFSPTRNISRAPARSFYDSVLLSPYSTRIFGR
jgi:hypothetical protein